jgi:hypothetical protein
MTRRPWSPENTVGAVLALVAGIPIAVFAGWWLLFNLRVLVLGVFLFAVWRANQKATADAAKAEGSHSGPDNP